MVSGSGLGFWFRVVISMVLSPLIWVIAIGLSENPLVFACCGLTKLIYQGFQRLPQLFQSIKT